MTVVMAAHPYAPAHLAEQIGDLPGFFSAALERERR
jgi:hypothetical protein